MATCFNQQSNHGIMGDLHHEEEEEEDDDIDSISSSSSLSNVSSNSSEFMEDATSSSSCGGGGGSEGLFEMQSLMQQLPFKRRGLSRHYQGKSQSFTSLSKVTCLEDLAKSEPPCKKKLKSCKSYGGNLCDTNNKVSHPKTSPRMISKKGSSRGSWSSSSLAASKKSSGFLGSRPPMPPQRTSSLFNQTPLFA